MTLLNLLFEAPRPKTSQRGSDLGLLRQLSRLWLSLENLSHVLIWSSSFAKTRGEICDVTLIELPRLRLSFKTRKDRDGKIRTYSCDYGDLFVSDNQSNAHTIGMPRVLVLEDLRGRQFLLVPNWKLSRPKILTRPLSTLLVTSLRKEEWETRHFIYTVHSSGTFLITKTLAASLYLAVLRIHSRQYVQAARVISECHKDSELTEEEK